jgi:hypothetical protein
MESSHGDDVPRDVPRFVPSRLMLDGRVPPDALHDQQWSLEDNRPDKVALMGDRRLLHRSLSRIDPHGGASLFEDDAELVGAVFGEVVPHRA